MTKTGTSALLEREEELARIRETIAAAVDARAGSVLLLEGPPGVGKTRLLSEAQQYAQDSGLTVLAAIGGELERDFPYGVVRQLFETPLLTATQPERTRLLDGAAGFAAPAVGLLPQHDAPAPDVDYAILHGLYWLVANLAARGPLLLAVDDAHWVDEASLRYLSYLGRRIADLPVVVAVASRPAEADPDAPAAFAGNSAVRTLHPPPLSQTAVAMLVRDRLGESADEALCHACHMATAGNPFFVLELLRALVEEHPVSDADAALRVRALGAGAALDAVRVRLGRLAPDAQAVAGAAAVLGAAAPLHHVAALAELDESSASAAADALTAATILATGRPLQFVHPVMREAVYMRLSTGERALAHLRAARLLAEWGDDPNEVAAHLLHVDPKGDGWAVEALRKAARGALARGAPSPAVAFLERALSEPPDPDVRGPVLHELGVAELRAGRLDGPSEGDGAPGAIAHLREAAALTRRGSARVAAARDFADALWASDRFAEAFAVLEGAIAEVGAPNTELSMGLEAHLAAVGWLDRTKWPTVSPRLDAAAQFRGDGPAERLLLGMLSLRELLNGAPSRVVADLAERALSSSGASEGLTPQAVNFPGIALYCCDRLEQAERAFSARIAEGRNHGEVRAVVALLCWRGETLRRMGQLADAESDAREAIAISRERSWSIAMPGTRAVLAETLLDRGDAAQALNVLDGSFTVTDYWSWNVFLHARGRALLASGDAAAALPDLLEAGARQLDWGRAGPALLPWRSSAAAAHAALGNTGGALELAREELELAQSFAAPRAIAVATRAAAAVESSEPSIALLSEAVRGLEGSPAVLDLGATLIELGSVLRRTGQRKAAREPLRRGLDIAQRLAAQTLATRAHEELLATGARPRRLVLTGVSSLTPSERRVARIAAEGLTNREIAQALFVSERTIETHLGHCYGKLGITSREQLAGVLEED